MRKYILFKLLLCSSLILINNINASETESATIVDGGIFYIPDGTKSVQYKMDIQDSGECYVGDNDPSNGIGICVFQEPGGSRSNIGNKTQGATLVVNRDGELLNNNKLTIYSNSTVLTTGLFVNQNSNFQVLGKLYCGVFPKIVETDGDNAGKWKYLQAGHNGSINSQNSEDYIMLEYWTYGAPKTSIANYTSCGGILNGFNNSNFFEYDKDETSLISKAYTTYIANNGEYKIEDGVIIFIPGSILNGVQIYEKDSEIKTITADDSTTDSEIDNKKDLVAQISNGTVDLSKYISLNNENNIVLETYSDNNLNYVSSLAAGQQLNGHLLDGKVNLFTNTELNSAKKLTIDTTLSDTTGIFNNLTFTNCTASIPDDISGVYKLHRQESSEEDITLPETENTNIYQKQRTISEYIYKLLAYSEPFNNYKEVSKLFNSNINKIIYNGIVDNSGNVIKIYGRTNTSDDIVLKESLAEYGLLLKNKGGDEIKTFSELFNTYKDYNGYIEVPSDNNGIIYTLTDNEKAEGVDYLNLTLNLPNSNATSGYHSLDVYLQLMKNKNIKISHQYVNISNSKSDLYAAPLRLYLKNPWYYSYNSGSNIDEYSGGFYRDLPLISKENIKTSIPGSTEAEQIQNCAPEYLSQLRETYIIPNIDGYGTSPLDTNTAKVQIIAKTLLNNNSATSSEILTKLCDILNVDVNSVEGENEDDKISAIADDYLAETEIYYATTKDGSDALLDYLVNLKFIDLMKNTVEGADTNAKLATLANNYLNRLEISYVASKIANYGTTNAAKVKAIVQALDNTASDDQKILNYLVLAINNINMTDTSSKISCIASKFLSMMETKVDTSKIENYSDFTDEAKIKSIVKVLDSNATTDEKVLDYLMSVLVDTIDGDNTTEKIATIADDYLSYMENKYTASKITDYSSLDNSNKVITLVKKLKANDSMTNDEVLEYLLQVKADDKESLNIQICQDYDGPAFHQYKTTFQNGSINETLKSELTNSEKTTYSVGCNCDNFTANGGNATTAFVVDKFSIGYGDHSAAPIIIQNTASKNTNILTQNLVINKGCTFYANGIINVKDLKVNDFSNKRILN